MDFSPGYDPFISLNSDTLEDVNGKRNAFNGGRTGSNQLGCMIFAFYSFFFLFFTSHQHSTIRQQET